MQRFSINLCILLVLVIINVALAGRVVVCSRSSGPALTEAVKAASLDVYSQNVINSTVVSSFEPVLLTLTDSAIQNQAAAQTEAAVPDTALAIVDSADNIVAATFGAANIPVVLLSNPTEETAVPLKVESAPLAARGAGAIFSLFHAFQWTSAGLVYSPAYEEVATRILDLASTSNPAVSFSHTATIDSSFPDSLFSSVISNLERGTSRVVVVVAPFSVASRLLAALGDLKFEFVLFDPMDARDARASLNLAPLFRTTILGNPRGLFVISADRNEASLEAATSRLKNFNSTYFESQISNAAMAAYDAMFLYSNAVVDVYNAGGDIANGASVHSALISAPKSSIFGYTFNQADSTRIGNFAVWNIHLNITSGNTTWHRIATWSGFVSPLTIPDLSVLKFANGSSIVPSSTQMSSIAIGFICPTIRTMHFALRALAARVIDEINANSSMLPAGRNFRIVYGDNLDSASNTITTGVELVSRGAVAIVGPPRSTQSIALQYYLGGPRVPAIAFASTLDSLSDKINYPMSFRTIVRDSYQSKALAALINNEGWKEFCILHYSDDYASGIVSNLISEAAKFNISVSGRGSYTPASADLNPAITPIVSAGCRVIVAVVDQASFGRVMRLAKANDIFGSNAPGYVWIFTEIASSMLDPNTIKAQNLTLADFHGSLLTNPVEGLASDPVYQHYKTIAAPITAQFGISSISFGTFIYDAVWAAALAATRTFNSGQEPQANRTAYLDNLRTISFPGASGRVSFDSNQDRVGGIYGYFNFRDYAAKAVSVGLWDPNGVTWTDSIIFPDNTTITPPDRIAANATRPITALLYASGGGGIISAIAALALVVFVGTGIFIFFKSNDIDDPQSLDIIRKSSPLFLGIILFGLCLAVISVFFWFSPTEDATGPARCHLRVWFAFVGGAIAYAALLAKNWRLWYLFNEPTLRVIAIKNQQLLSILTLVVLPLLIVMVLWSAINPFQDTLQLNAAQTLRYRVCVSSNDTIFAGISFAYMGLLLLFGSILSWKTRTLPDVFKESQFIALSTYNLLFVALVGVLIGYILSFEPPAYTYIITVCILAGSLATWALIFIPKFYVMRYGLPSSRTSGSSSTRIGGPNMHNQSKMNSMIPSSNLHPSLPAKSETSVSKHSAPPAESSSSSDDEESPDSSSKSSESDKKPAKTTKSPKGSSKKSPKPKPKESSAESESPENTSETSDSS